MSHEPIITQSTLPQKEGHFITYKRIAFPHQTKPEWFFLSGYRADFTGTKACFLWELAHKTQVNCTLFEYFGCGGSSGNFEEATIGRWRENALSVLDELTSGPIVLIGSSMGGWLMALLLRDRPNRFVRAVGIGSAPDFSEDLFFNYLTSHEKQNLIEKGHAQLMRPGGPLVLSRLLVEEGRHHLVLDSPLVVPCPVFLLHGLYDDVVPWTSSQKLLDKLEAPFASLMLIKEGDHSLTRPQDLEVLHRLIGG